MVVPPIVSVVSYLNFMVARGMESVNKVGKRTMAGCDEEEGAEREPGPLADFSATGQLLTLRKGLEIGLPCINPFF